MIEGHLPGLQRLNALKLDWGRNEQFRYIPLTCLEFSKKLEAKGVKHFAEEYLGDHASNIGGFEGRVYLQLLPFFNKYLHSDSKTSSAPALSEKKQGQ
jgi:hypothetical protein